MNTEYLDRTDEELEITARTLDSFLHSMGLKKNCKAWEKHINGFPDRRSQWIQMILIATCLLYIHYAGEAHED